MPDDNKFGMLRKIGYRIKTCCGLCIHGRFSNASTQWGQCELHRYRHLKHHNPGHGRAVSIHRAGACDDAALDDFRFGGHAEFLQ